MREINLYTVPMNFMDETAKRIAKLEKEVKRNRRRTGLLVGVCIGLAFDIYAIMKEMNKKETKTEEKKRDD